MILKKAKLILCVLLFPLSIFNSYSQENSVSDAFSFHSVSASPLGVFFGEAEERNDNSLFVGPAFSAQLTFNYKKHLFGISGTIGTQVDWNNDDNDWFYEFDLLYGREFNLGKRLYIEAFGGVGILSKHFGQSVNDNGGVENSSVFAVPLKLKLSPLVTGNFAIGFQIQTTLSDQKPLFTGGLLLQYYRKPKF